MIIVHETYEIETGCLGDFEETYLNAVTPQLERMPGVEPLCLLCQRDGLEGELAISLNAVRTSEDLRAFLDWTTSGEGAAERRLSTEFSRGRQRKVLMAAPWSPMRDWEEVADGAFSRDMATGIFMEDTGWPYAKLSAYVDFQHREYWEPLQKWLHAGALLRLRGFFVVAFGSGQRPEAVFLQEVLDTKALERLVGEPEKYDPETFPGSYMVHGLQYRDQWRSRILLSAAAKSRTK